MGHFLPKNFHDSDWLINPFQSNILQNGIITIIRIFLYSRKFINLNHNIEIYSEKCFILDDYIAYLHFLDNSLYKQMKSLIINSDGIYLYNNLNNNSVSLKYKEKFNHDYQIILNYQSLFQNLNNNLGKSWNIQNIDYKQLSYPFNEKLNITHTNNNIYTICKDDIYTKKNYLYFINFVTQFLIDYYDLCINQIEYYLFINLNDINKSKAYDLCNFLIQNNIHDRRLFIYIAILYFYKNNHNNLLYYINKSDYYISKYPQLKSFLNNN